MPALDVVPQSGISDELLALITSAPLPGLDDQPKCTPTKDSTTLILADGTLRGTLAEAGLWLLSGELELSHAVSQDHDSSEGSFWHGIMHRRERDFGNSKYWFRRVGAHPVHSELSRLISERRGELAQDLPFDDFSRVGQLPNALVDACESAIHGKSVWEASLQKICWWEWQLLFAACSQPN